VRHAWLNVRGGQPSLARIGRSAVESHIVAQCEIIAAALREAEGMEHERGCKAAWFRRARDGRTLHRTYIVSADCNCARGRLIAILKGGL
jgi:hypothetical protein